MLQTTRQQILPLEWQDERSFDNFDPGVQPENALALQALHDLLQLRRHNALYLWGETGSGKSHLLWAACRELQKQGR